MQEFAGSCSAGPTCARIDTDCFEKLRRWKAGAEGLVSRPVLARK